MFSFLFVSLSQLFGQNLTCVFFVWTFFVGYTIFGIGCSTQFSWCVGSSFHVSLFKNTKVQKKKHFKLSLQFCSKFQKYNWPRLKLYDFHWEGAAGASGEVDVSW